VPVQYQFKDRDTRAFAEKTLRDTCGVNCATPYPAVIRESIKQVIDHVKKSHPDDYVKVNVMTKEFSLKVSRRPKGQNQDWITLPDLIPLPDEAWDVAAKKAPDGLKVTIRYEDDSDFMQVTSPGKSSGGKTPPPLLRNLLKNKQ
jgi:hypothetical protein